MRFFKKYIFLIIGLGLFSCEGIVDNINENPNELTPEDVNPEFFLTGAMLANTVAQAGHMNRISGLWSGQLQGFASLYANIYGYSISTAETNGTWNRVYIGIVTNTRIIQERAPENKLLVGISKVLEAHAIGTMATLCGDIPYSEIGIETIPDPRFDEQGAVFQAVIALLESAVSDLTDAPSNPGLTQDIYFEGDATKWLEAAYTLQARYYLQMKDYAKANAAAQNGISSSAGTMAHIPRGDPAITEGDKNLFWEIYEDSRAGDIGTGDSYLMQLINPDNPISRSNAKTNEFARFHYYSIDETNDSNLGIVEQFEPQHLVSYEENHLILAETGARTSFEDGLAHLNELRAYLNEGGRLNVNFIDSTYLYEAYEAADFAAGGMENADGIDPTRALLREIIEERYVSGFGMYMPFNDSRRLRKSDSDIAVPFPLNPGSTTQYPERMPYADDELNSNSNAPTDDPGIFVVTDVNQ